MEGWLTLNVRRNTPLRVRITAIEAILGDDGESAQVLVGSQLFSVEEDADDIFAAIERQRR